MSEVITGALKFAFNLIRSYSAEKLEDGGLTDQKFRGWIARELDDIKFKLDALSRKDLFASISCLGQGFERLIMSFEQTTETADPPTSELPKNEKQSEDTTNPASTSTQTKPAKASEVIDAVALANAIAKLKIVSNKRFESAMESFKEAGKEARRAFHNTALNTEERILASKVRIASGILEHLDDPEFAASDCLQYLQELHDLPAIQDIFSVHIKAGIKSWIKSGFKKDSRIEIVETVTMINLILADFISKFTKRRMGVLDWPLIKCGKRVVQPVHYEKDSLPNLKKLKITPPWEMVKSAKCDYAGRYAFNTKRDLVCCAFEGHGVKKLDKTTGKLQPYCVSPSQDKHNKKVYGLAVDDEDTVYVLSCDDDHNYTLSVYNESGVNMHHCTLEFLKGTYVGIEIRMCVTEDKNTVICYLTDKYDIACALHVWLCGSNGELRNSFIDKNMTDFTSLMCVNATCNNEIRVVTQKMNIWTANDNVLHIYTEDGHLQRTARFRQSGWGGYHSMIFNKATKNIIGCTFYHDDSILVEFWSDQTAKLLGSYLLYKTNLPVDLYNPSGSLISLLIDRGLWSDLLNLVVCHGTLALVDTYQNVLFLTIKTCT